MATRSEGNQTRLSVATENNSQQGRSLPGEQLSGLSPLTSRALSTSGQSAQAKRLSGMVGQRRRRQDCPASSAPTVLLSQDAQQSVVDNGQSQQTGIPFGSPPATRQRRPSDTRSWRERRHGIVQGEVDAGSGANSFIVEDGDLGSGVRDVEEEYDEEGEIATAAAVPMLSARTQATAYMAADERGDWGDSAGGSSYYIGPDFPAYYRRGN